MLAALTIAATLVLAVAPFGEDPAGRLLLVDLLAFGVTPGLPFLVTALAAVLLPARLALGFGFAQVLLNTAIYAAPQPTPWLDQLGLLSSMLALHGLAFGLGRMAAAEAEKRRWLQAVLAEQLSGEQLLAEQMRYSERMQIARELHDLMGHHLTALNLQLQLSEALLKRNDPDGASQAVARRALHMGCTLAAEHIITTASCTQGVSLCLQAVTRPGDVIAIESPAFYAGLQASERLGLRVVEVPTHPRLGVDPAALCRPARSGVRGRIGYAGNRSTPQTDAPASL